MNKNKTKPTRFRRIFWIMLTFLWMILIFSFSSRPANVSTQDSSRVGLLIGQILHSDFEEWPAEEQNAYSESISYPVRKTAHALEYAVLGIFSCMAWSSCSSNCNRQKKRLISVPLCAWITSALYASSDEFHQLFVPGRSGQISDVLLDSCGAFAGILLLCIIARSLSRAIL